MNDDFCRLVGQHLTTEQARGQRKSLRESVLAILAALCLAGLVVAATEAYGAGVRLVADYGHLKVYLYDKPCTNKVVLSMLEERVHKTYKAGEAVHAQFGSRELCYLSLPKYANIFILDAEGEQVNLPKADFGLESPQIEGRKGQVSI